MNGLVRHWLTGSGLKLNVAERATHMHIVGQPGTGKSRLLESWAMQDIVAGHGVAVIDPHGDLYQHLVWRIAALLPRMPELAERVVLVNPNDPTWTVGFNPLQPVKGIALERLAWFLTDVIIKIWKLDTASMPRMLRLITYSFLTLAEFDLSLVDLPRFLFENEWRQSLVARTQYREVADYFRQEFPTKAGAVHQWVTPVLNKIGPLIFDPDVRLMLATRSTINFREILDRKLVLLVNLSKGILGEGNSALLGAFFVARLQQAALSRANSRHREHYFLYLDEFQNYTTDNIKDILSESRKYGLSLVLAHQYLDQLAVDLRMAVLNTAGTMVSFRVGYHDAHFIAPEIFPPGYLRESHQELEFARMARLPIPLFEEKQEPLEHEALVALLTQLRPREFWTKRRGSYAPMKQRALNMPEPEPGPQLYTARKQLIEASGQRFGKLKTTVREELNHARSNGNAQSTTYYEKL
jgi:hypothetical protein